MTEDCEVKDNCNMSYDCWMCNNYSLYSPIDKRIKCGRQIKNKVARQEKKKSEASKRGRSNRNKGLRAERDFVKMCLNNGIKAEKVAGGGVYKHINKENASDVKIWDEDGNMYTVEVKASKNGFGSMYKKFDDVQPKFGKLAVYSDKLCSWILCMNQSAFCNHIKKTEKECASGTDFRGFSKVVDFFKQDDADFVAVKSPWKEWLVFVKE